jgi:hypothetical protein
MDTLRQNILLVIMPVFFLSTGLRTALIMIIFVNVLLDKGVITSTTFTALLLMAVGSTMLTIPLATPKLQRLRAVIFKAA